MGNRRSVHRRIGLTSNRLAYTDRLPPCSVVKRKQRHQVKACRGRLRPKADGGAPVNDGRHEEKGRPAMDTGVTTNDAGTAREVDMDPTDPTTQPAKEPKPFGSRAPAFIKRSKPLH